jgi:DNA polymerase III subunit epsilon
MLLPPEPRSIRDLDFAVIDLETTGGHPKARWSREGRFHPAAEITDVGAVLMRGTIIQDRISQLCAVETPIPAIITELTGISQQSLEGAPRWERVAMMIAPRLEGRIWLAHHAPFDGAFLKAHLPEGLWSRHRLICTRLLAKKLIPEVPRRSLAELCAFLGIVNVRAHRALPDAEATAELLQHLIERAEALGLDADAFLETGQVDWVKL